MAHLGHCPSHLLFYDRSTVSRPLRVEFPGAHYHVMNRGLERRQTFLDDRDHNRFLLLLEDTAQRWKIEVYAYCCMANHYHIALQTPHGNLARVMRHLDGVYTQWFNVRRGRDGPLFRGRYKAILIDADCYLTRVVRYIHRNPVRAGLVSEASAYPWSSHRAYIAPDAPIWLGKDRVLASFEDVSAFERFVGEGDDPELEAFYRRRRWSPFLGDKSFITAALKVARLHREHPRTQRFPQFPDIASVVRRIGELTETPAEQMLVGRSGKENLPRSLAIYVASRMAGFSHPEILRHFHLNTHSAISQCCWKTGRLLAARDDLRKLFAKL